MPITWSFTVAPTSEPVSTAEAQAHLRIIGNDEDTYLAALISAARELFEGATGRVIMPATVREKFDHFPFSPEHDLDMPRPGYAVGFGFGVGWGPYGGASRAILRLNVAPVRAVSSVNYLDANGASQVMDPSTYTADVVSEPARIQPGYATLWPQTRAGVIGSVWVDYTVGYTTVPVSVKQAILLLVGHWHENREAATDVSIRDVPLALQTLIERHSVYTR